MKTKMRIERESKIAAIQQKVAHARFEVSTLNRKINNFIQDGVNGTNIMLLKYKQDLLDASARHSGLVEEYIQAVNELMKPEEQVFHFGGYYGSKNINVFVNRDGIFYERCNGKRCQVSLDFCEKVHALTVDTVKEGELSMGRYWVIQINNVYGHRDQVKRIIEVAKEFGIKKGEYSVKVESINPKPADRPMHKHDCPNCVYLGSMDYDGEQYDLFYHIPEKGDDATLMADKKDQKYFLDIDLQCYKDGNFDKKDLMILKEIVYRAQNLFLIDQDGNNREYMK